MAVVLRPLVHKEIIGEEPIGSVDGINVLFTTLSSFVWDSIKIYYNGQRLRSGATNDYQQVSNNQFTLATPPIPGDVILVDYLRG